MATWNFDPTHSSADFSVRHMMVSTVRGGFKAVNGTLEFDPNNKAIASVEATIDATSLATTGVADRDAHLRSADFLDVENYPALTFKSTAVELTGEDTAKVTGDLTIRDVTKPVVLDVEFLGQAKSPYGHDVIGFQAETKINREDFGLTWNMALEAGGFMVGKDIKIELSVEAAPA